MIRCRTGHVGDTPSLYGVECRSFDVSWSEKALAEALADSAHRAVVAEEDSSNHAVGYVLVRTVLDETEVLRVAVIPSRRGRGVASALMTEVLRIAFDEGAEWAFLEVESTNDAALALYARFGFIPVGLRKAYYMNDKDALIMKKRLQGGTS